MLLMSKGAITPVVETLLDVIGKPSTFRPIVTPGWSNRNPFIPCIDQHGQRMRAAGVPAAFCLTESIKPGTGWHTMTVRSSSADDVDHRVFIREKSSNKILLEIEFDNTDDSHLWLGLHWPTATKKPAFIFIKYIGLEMFSSGIEELDFDLSDKSQIQIELHCSPGVLFGWAFEVNTGLNLANRPFDFSPKSHVAKLGFDVNNWREGINGSNYGQFVEPQAFSIKLVGDDPLTLAVEPALTDGFEASWYNYLLKKDDPQVFSLGSQYQANLSESYYVIKLFMNDPQTRERCVGNFVLARATD